MRQNKTPGVLAVLATLLIGWWFFPPTAAQALTDASQPPTTTTSNGPWTNFANPAGPADDPILSMAHSPTGYLWVGTRTGLSIRSPQGEWRTLTTADGLAGNMVFAITPDPANPQRHWFATNRGASLLDDGGAPFDSSKHRWVTFGKQDGMIDNRLSAITLAADGKVWFGASHVDILSCEEIGFGVNVLDLHGTPFDKSDDTWQTFTAANSSLPSDIVRRLRTDARGIIWLALQGSLTAYQNGQWFTFSSDQGLLSNDVIALATTDSLVWVGTRQGFGVLDYGAGLADRSDDRWQNFPNPTSADDAADSVGNTNETLRSVSAIALDDQGRIWLASNKFEFTDSCSNRFVAGKTAVLDPHTTPFDLTDDTWITLTVPITLTTDQTDIRALALETGGAWLATKNAILHFRPGADLAASSSHQWSREPSGTGVAGNTVGAIAADDGNRIWFSQDGSVYRVDYRDLHNLRDDAVASWSVGARTLALDAKQRLWVGQSSVRILDLSTAYDGQAVEYQTLAVYDSNSHLLSTDINEIVIDEKGWAWIANGNYLEGGVNVLDVGEIVKDERDDRWATFTNQHSGLTAKHVTAVALAKDQVAWVGSNSGAARLQYGASPFDKSDDVWTLFTSSNSGLAGDIVRDIAVDAKGNVWFALAAGGVSVYGADGAWVTFTTADGLAYDSVNAVALDASGKVWLGTDGDGVSVLDHGNTLTNKADDKWTTHRPGTTLLSGYVLRIMVDRFGQVWVGTFDGGLSVYSTTDFQQVYFPIISFPDTAVQP